MKSAIIKSAIPAITGLITLILTGCNIYSTTIAAKDVTTIPEGRYGRIIKLYNPDGAPDKTLAGVVFVKEGAKVCTDYPREETIKSLDDLEMMEKNAYRYFSCYAIEAGGTVLGYFALALEYRALIYENLKNEDCTYKLVIIEPEYQTGIGEIPRSRHHIK